MPPYNPRLSDAGMYGNPYWYSRSPFYPNDGLPNCTCYAFGRWWECSDINHDFSNYPNLCTGNAEDWFNYNDGYARGTAPALGAVACWADGPFSGLGHVAIVEEIHPDGSITVSDSAWNGWYFDTHVFYPPDYLPAAGYVFQGFIYNPITGGGPGPFPPGWWKKVWMYKKWWWKRQEELIQ